MSQWHLHHQCTQRWHYYFHIKIYWTDLHIHECYIQELHYQGAQLNNWTKLLPPLVHPSKSAGKSNSKEACVWCMFWLFYSFGVCKEFKGQSSICDSVFSKKQALVYQSNKVQNVSAELHDFLSDEILGSNHKCNDLVRNIVCHYFLPSCGINGTVHLPRGVCSDECSYVQYNCSDEWKRVNTYLRHTSLGAINCTATQSYLSPLPACCTSVGVIMPGNVFVPGTITHTRCMQSILGARTVRSCLYMI